MNRSLASISISTAITLLSNVALADKPLLICRNLVTGAVVAKARCNKQIENPITVQTIAGIAVSQSAAGPQGPAGATGPTGAAGSRGADGASGFGPIPSGTTVHGVSGNFASISGYGIQSSYSSFAGFAPSTLTDLDVIVKATRAVTDACQNLTDCLDSEELSGQGFCTGSAENPTAPAGKVCIYPTTFINVYGLHAIAVGNGKYGFGTNWAGDRTLLSYSLFDAVWAYTAP